MRKGICCAGNMLVDESFPISKWPNQGELAYITEEKSMSTGGSACNTIMDLARLDPALPLFAAGVAGHDEEGDFIISELKKYSNIDITNISRSGHTTYTLVMSNNETKERTFFVHMGGTESFSEKDLQLESITADIFHIGYILLLPGLDRDDDEYGTKMARLLCHAQKLGMRTSVDMVTERGEKVARIAKPALKYCNLVTINEIEAQEITGIMLRDENKNLLKENLPAALKALKDCGVSTWAVIHCPELGCGLDENNKYHEFESLKLPKDYIKGTVGAGDAFCAGILYAAHQGLPLDKALKLATCTAAASLASTSASGSVGAAQEVLKLAQRV